MTHPHYQYTIALMPKLPSHLSEGDTVANPADFGPAALEYLISQGYSPLTPTIRSSDAEYSDEFMYLLNRRFGFRPGLSYSQALVRGEHFHTVFALTDHPNYRTEYAQICDARQAELKGQCKAYEFGEDATFSILERDQKDAAAALGWYVATESVKIPVKGKDRSQWFTFQEWLRKETREIIASEVHIAHHDPEYPDVYLVIQLDLLVYHRTSNRIWIVDAKTCDCSPTIRLATCKQEFQTKHYMHVVQKALDAGVLQSKFDLPADVTLGGMIHMAVQKPPIIFGQKDRDYRIVSDGKRKKVKGSVKRTHASESEPYQALWQSTDEQSEEYGVVYDFKGSYEDCIKHLHEMTGKKPEKVYEGEPTVDNYVKRCLHWYHGTGDYATNADIFAIDPPVNFSYTSAASFQEKAWSSDYTATLDYIYDLATRDAQPRLFRRTYRHLSRYGKLSDYAHFYTNPVGDWPRIIDDLNFVQNWRDEDLLDSEEMILNHGEFAITPEYKEPTT